MHLFRVNPRIQNYKICPHKTIITQCEWYFDILNCLGASQECDGCTDRQIERHYHSKYCASLYCVAKKLAKEWAKCLNEFLKINLEPNLWYTYGRVLLCTVGWEIRSLMAKIIKVQQ